MNIFSLLLSILFPSRCVICDKIIKNDMSVCEACSEMRLHPAAKGVKCDICFLSPADCCCRKKTYYRKFSAPFKGSEQTRKSVYKIKYSARLDKLKPFALLMADALKERNMLDTTDIISFIPMGDKSKRKRGFNQAEELAKALSEITDIPMEALLYKYLSTEPQHSVGGTLARSGNLLGAYEPYKEKLNIIANKNILLIDDIMTTGNTFNEAAKTLLIFGADNVYCSSVIISEKKQNKRYEQ